MLNQNDDAGGGYAPPGETAYYGGASRIDIPYNSYVAGNQYLICITTFGSNVTSGGARCTAWVIGGGGG